MPDSIWQERKPNKLRVLELGCQDADDRCRLVVELDRLAYDGWVTPVVALPETVREKHDEAAVRLVLVGREGSAQYGLYFVGSGAGERDTVLLARGDGSVKRLTWRLARLLFQVPAGALRAVADDVLSGRYFESEGIENRVEEDFFRWVRMPEAEWMLAPIWERTLAQMQTYDLGRLGQDVLKGVSEEFDDPKDRHDLGKYTD